MIVCPACRTANDEDVATCASCGGSLAPGPAALRARRAPTERRVVEVPLPSPPSRARPFVVIGALVVGLVAGIGWLVARPDPCRGATFTSASFGYCVVVPQGWTSSPARFGNGAVLDGFSLTGGSASILVEAVDLADGTDLADWASTVRDRDGEAGLRPGTPREAIVAGFPARAWELTSESEDGTRYRTREVVVVRDGIGWRIVLNETQAGFDAAATALETLLDSWRFR
ncbi:MAG: hypothetical protein ACKOI0_05075 [Actinomycetota bacterium]